MKKKYRLLKSADFEKVLKQKRKISNKESIIYYYDNVINNIRIGISVSTKIGNSVVRHKIKRQVKEILKSFINFNEQKDYVIIIREGFLNNSFLENKEKMKNLFSKVDRVN